MHMLVLEGHQEGNVRDLIVRPLGTTSAPSALVYLDDSYVFVGSQHGDSQVCENDGHVNAHPIPEYRSHSPSLFPS